MACECLRLRSELEKLRNLFSNLEKNHQIQVELVRTKTKEQYDNLLQTQKDGFSGLQEINLQEINKLKEIIYLKNQEIEKLISQSTKYRVQLNSEQETSIIKISAARRESSDSYNQISKYHEELVSMKCDFSSREEIINQQHQLRIEEISLYYTNLLKSNSKEKYELLSRTDELSVSNQQQLKEIGKNNDEIASLRSEVALLLQKMEDGKCETKKLQQKNGFLIEEIALRKKESEIFSQSIHQVQDVDIANYEDTICNLQIEINKLLDQNQKIISESQLVKEEKYKLQKEVSRQSNLINDYKHRLSKLENVSQVCNNQFSEMLENQKKRLEECHSFELQNLQQSYQTQILLIQQQSRDQSNHQKFQKCSDLPYKPLRKSIADF